GYRASPLVRRASGQGRSSFMGVRQDLVEQCQRSVRLLPRKDPTMPRVSVVDLAGVDYSSGKVFDGLATGRLDTESFLRSGDTAGVSSVNDLNLLNDLKAAAEFIIEHQDETIDETFLTRVNAQLTRSASIQPGHLRRGD